MKWEEVVRRLMKASVRLAREAAVLEENGSKLEARKKLELANKCAMKAVAIRLVSEVMKR